MLDIKTLILILGLLVLISPILFYLLHKYSYLVGGTMYWAGGAALTAIGLFMLVPRDVLPGFITIVLANIIISIACGLIWSGMRVFTDRRPMNRTVVLVSLLTGLALWWFSAVEPSLSLRVVIISFTMGLFSVLIARDLATGALDQKRPMRIFGTAVYSLNALYMVVRSILALVEPMQEPYFQSGTINQFLYVWSIVYVFLAFASIVMMVGEKLQAEIKNLRGIVPICSQCKKVRDDTGYWQQVERYISAHSEAEFTHGLCPDCLEKAMADIDLAAAEGGTYLGKKTIA